MHKERVPDGPLFSAAGKVGRRKQQHEAVMKKAGHGRASSVACFDILRLFVGIVIEVALNIDDRGTLVAGAAGQVAQGADKIRQVPGGRPSDTMLPTRLTEASFPGSSVPPPAAAPRRTDHRNRGPPDTSASAHWVYPPDRRYSRGDHGIRQLPDLAHRILEGAPSP